MSNRFEDISAQLSLRQRNALPYICQAKSIEEACKNARISRRTYYSWMDQETFVQAVEAMQMDVLTRAIGMLEGYATRAAEALTALLATENEPLRRAVCNDILDRIVKHRELTSIAERLEKLEQALTERNDIKNTNRRNIAWTNQNQG